MQERIGVRKDEIVIFLHIPKTAGLTLYDIFDREYGRAHIFTFVGGRERLEHSVNTFKALPEGERSAFQLLRGHTPFGIHTQLSKPFRYMTFLRDPVKRVVSHYYYVLNNPDHLLHETVTSQKMSLETYVASGINYELDNGQTRQLAGITNEIPYGACNQELLEQAKINLKTHFSFVGLTERFNESLLIMRHVLGWRRFPFYVRQNVSREKTAHGEIPAQVVRLLEQYNELDSALYAYGREQFSGYLQLIGEGEMVRFLQLNRLYYPWGRLQSVGRSTWRWLR